MEKGLTNLAGAILVVGLASISVYAELKSNFRIGDGWGILAVLAFFFYGWKTKD